MADFPYPPEKIAEAIHEGVRLIQIAVGEPAAEHWLQADDWEHDASFGAFFDLKAHPDRTPEQAWQQWAASKREAGWVYGPVKDPVLKTHPCLTENYQDLPPAQAAKDEMTNLIFRVAAGRF